MSCYKVLNNATLVLSCSCWADIAYDPKALAARIPSLGNNPPPSLLLLPSKGDINNAFQKFDSNFEIEDLTLRLDYDPDQNTDSLETQAVPRAAIKRDELTVSTTATLRGVGYEGMDRLPSSNIYSH